MAEKEYIERGALIADISKTLDTHYLGDTYSDFFARERYLIESLRNAPAADVVEVRHGEWIAKSTMFRSPSARNYYCSACQYEPIETKSYCPNCGAKMDGKRKDNP